MYYFSVIIVIIASIVYTFFQNLTPANVNPIMALCFMYLGGIIIALPFYLNTKGDYKVRKKHFDWRIVYFSLTNIVIDLGFLLAFRSGWALGTLNVISNIIVLIVLAITGVIFFKEKLSKINIIGIITGVIGLILLSL
jgi:drug/metabolite transporter (DMT)-like permease